MRQFTSPRTRLFGPRRFRWRYALFAALAVTITAGALALTRPETAAPTSTATDAKMAFMAAEPVTATTPDTSDSTAAKDVALTSLQQKIGGIISAGTQFLDSQKKLSVGKGDTLMNLLVANNVPRTQAYEAIQALTKVYNPRGLNPGHEVTVFFHQDPAIADPQFRGLSIEKDIVNTVSVNRDNDGRYTVAQTEKDVEKQMRAFKGTIDSSLYVSAKAAGVPDGVILDLIKMYSWGVDFQRDIQSGDTFEVMYEEYVTEDGESIPGKGEIVFARLALGDRDMPFYLFKDSGGDSGYYDEQGHSAKKTLMKTPIDGARLSSGFGMRRHPVLGYSKMHKGVDFAAPRGTPIYAAGDGTVIKMGPFSSYGNYVRIRHRSGLETAYAHMKGFKAGLHTGSRIKQGEVIGYVGTTGRSTGPHLHYEVLLGSKQVNPNSLKLPTGRQLAGRDLKQFKSLAAGVDRQFHSLSTATAVARNGEGSAIGAN